jgi:putative membrane protein
VALGIGTRGDLPVKPSVVHQKESHFSWLRTRMSLERTLMSWVRTATALIGFGFTIFQFFERFNQMPGVEGPRLPGASRLIALGLIGSGVVALIVAIMEYREMLRYLWSPEFGEIAGVGKTQRTTPALIVALFLGIVGLIALVTVAWRTAGG